MIPFLKNIKEQIKKEIANEILEDNKKKYHVGKIVMETENINPATYLGFGTWTYWGKGRVPVGVDTNDTDFETVEQTGGEKTHKHLNGVSAYNDILTISNKDAVSSGSLEQAFTVNGTTGFTSVGNVTAYKYTTESSSSVQPYITCYMWKRTA